MATAVSAAPTHARMCTEDAITIHGLSRVFEAEDHHIDFLVEHEDRQYRICVVMAEGRQVKTNLYRTTEHGAMPIRDGCRTFTGDREDGVMSALLALAHTLWKESAQ